VTPLLVRLTREQMQRQAAAVTARILLEVGEDLPSSTGGATAAGDARRLRGLPAVGRGIGGAIPGTRPGVWT
jgi:hypothetical protein